MMIYAELIGNYKSCRIKNLQGNKLKSTLALLFALQRCGLYPNQKVVVVAPTKGQSSRFVKKVQELMRVSPNLRAEIEDVKIGQNESRILFHNGSEIITVPYNENALGELCA